MIDNLVMENELKVEIERRKIKYLSCIVFLKKDELEDGESLIQKAGINHKVLFFVSLFPKKIAQELYDKGTHELARIVAVDSAILYKEDNLRTYYDCYYKNKLATGLTTRHNSRSFQILFKNIVPASLSPSSNANCIHRKTELPDNLPTHPNACIIWDGIVKPEYIKGVMEIDWFLEFGPIIDDNLMEELEVCDDYLDDIEEGSNFYPPDEGDSFCPPEEEIDQLLENALRRDMEFGTNEYDELFQQYRHPPKKDYFPDYSDEDDEYQPTESEVRYMEYWEDETDCDPYDLVDFGYLEDLSDDEKK